MLPAPHGGDLINCHADASEQSTLERAASRTQAIALDPVAEADLEMLAIGGYSPLTGFVGSADQASVAQKMRLADGTLWPIPITLGVPVEQTKHIQAGDLVALKTGRGHVAGVIEVSEVYRRDLASELRQVFGTEDPAHPGVAQVLARGPWCVAGRVKVFGHSDPPEFADRRLAPADTRAIFKERGWKRVVGFQTRNPVHRAHEYIVKCALEMCDGLLLHPIVGFTKNDDIPADVRMRCYEALIAAVFPRDRTLLSVLPAPMRYAGPREAVLHAIVRKNYGCTHFIVGRDHAGVGAYYGTYDAQKIFDTFPPEDIGIEPLSFEHTFYCKSCGQMASAKTCPHDATSHTVLSGTKVRELLKHGERPPAEFTRPEVADILIGWARS